MSEMSDKERDAYEAAGVPVPGLTEAKAEQIAARNRSFTGTAVLVFLLYWFFWIPGFIVNIISYNEAKRVQRVAGQSPAGLGCLTAMLILAVISIVLTACSALFGLLLFV